MAKVLLLLASFWLLFSEEIHVYSQSQEKPDSVMVVRFQSWRICGMMALDSTNSDVSCCGTQQVFHRPTQRCCPVKKGFFVIQKDPEKTESEDCHSYTG